MRHKPPSQKHPVSSNRRRGRRRREERGTKCGKIDKLVKRVIADLPCCCTEPSYCLPDDMTPPGDDEDGEGGGAEGEDVGSNGDDDEEGQEGEAAPKDRAAAYRAMIEQDAKMARKRQKKVMKSLAVVIQRVTCGLKDC